MYLTGSPIFKVRTSTLDSHSQPPYAQLPSFRINSHTGGPWLCSLWRRVTGQAGLAKGAAMNLVGFATWVPVLALFNSYVAEITFVDGASMYPFLNADKDSTLRQDVVLNWKRAPQHDLERGMIVTLRCV